MTITATTPLTANRTASAASLTTPVTPLYSSDLLDLVTRSREALNEACAVSTSSQRYVLAHLSALRAAAALLAQKAPRGLSSRPRSAWDAVTQHVPELAEWAAFFAASGRRSRSVSAGTVVIGVREADDLVRQAESFLAAVLFHVGLPPMAPVSTCLAPVAVR